VSLPLALAVGHVHSWPPEDEEDVIHRREAPTSPSPPSFLASASFAVERM
jgi:hypothetical protein